jgi:hypothetical protein
VAISSVIAVTFAIIGGNIIMNALEMVGLFGADLGADDRSRTIYAESHRWVHLFAAACGLALGWFLSRRNWWLFGWALIAIFACGAYGVQNMYGFAVKNRVAVAAVKTDDKASALQQYENARKDLQGQIKWLQGLAVETESRRERLRLEASVDAKRRELSALRPPVVTADNAMADTSAAGLAVLTGTSANTQMFIWPFVLAVLMFLAEAFSFVVVGNMLSGIVALFSTYWATAKPPVEAHVASTKGGNNDSGGGSDVNKDGNVVPLHPAERSTSAVQAGPDAAIPAVERPVPATPQRSVTPVASAPWSDERVDALLKQRPLMAKRPTWRQLGEMTGWDHTTLFKRGQRLTGKQGRRPVLGQHRQQHRHQEGVPAFN